MIGLLEYSIPLGMPVSRKTTVGKLRGRSSTPKPAGRGSGAWSSGPTTWPADRRERRIHFQRPGARPLPSDARFVRRGASKITLERTPLEVSVAGGRISECSIGLVTGASVEGRILVYKIDRSEGTP